MTKLLQGYQHETYRIEWVAEIGALDPEAFHSWRATIVSQAFPTEDDAFEWLAERDYVFEDRSIKWGRANRFLFPVNPAHGLRVRETKALVREWTEEEA